MLRQKYIIEFFALFVLCYSLIITGNIFEANLKSMNYKMRFSLLFLLIRIKPPVIAPVISLIFERFFADKMTPK